MALISLTVFSTFFLVYAWVVFRFFATRLKLRPRLLQVAGPLQSERGPNGKRLGNQQRRPFVRRAVRVRKFNEGLPNMLDVVGNSLKVGHSFAQAIHLVVEDLEGPIQMEMRQLEHDVQVGFSMEDALDRAFERSMSEDFGLVVTAIKIQRQVGGNLAEVLDKVSSTIRDRIRIEREVKMLTAQGRFSAMIFMLLPGGIGFFLFMINPPYMSVLFTSPMGQLLLVMAAIGQGIGFMLIRKIIRVTL